ncbi:hypothetical protein [Pandoraea anhela]|uniref:hypothetical protein n=1 Tax=Pandoraea anhela TaxID=2508295 RepID=UPI001582D0DB|nr:hypothetical protein [Pandoraea anhela]
MPHAPEGIVRALAGKDGEKPAEIMLEYLGHIEHSPDRGAVPQAGGVKPEAGREKRAE